jgi:hypothetical protein
MHADHPEFELTHVEGDNINTGLLSVIFALAAVCLVLVVVLLQAWFYNLSNEVAMSADRLKPDSESLLGRALMEQQAKIKDYHWVNKEMQVRAIPIDRAMDLVVSELHASQAGGAKTAPPAGAVPAEKSPAEKESVKP